MHFIKQLIKHTLNLILIWLIIFIWNNVFANKFTYKKINITNEGVNVKTLKDKSYIYSPFDGWFNYINWNFYLYNKNKTIVIKLKGLSKYKNKTKIHKNDLIWVINKDKFYIKVYLKSKEQNVKVNIWFLSLLLKKEEPKVDITYNKVSFLDKIKKHSYFDSDYYKFFIWLSNNANKSLLSEKELLTYKLTLNDKFFNIVTKYDNWSLFLNKEEKKKYKQFYKFTDCLYNSPEFFCKEKYKKEYIHYNQLIKETYWWYYIPEELSFYKDILKKINTNKNTGYYSIAPWKIKYYVKYNVNENDFLTLNAINKQECWLESGACLSAWDAWPFQINYIHDKDYKYSRSLVKQIKNTKNLTEKQKLIEKLFDFQLNWTILRMNRLKNEWFCKSQTGDSLTRCQAILHNGNTRKTCYRGWRYIDFRYCYADSVVWIKHKIKQYYKIWI